MKDEEEIPTMELVEKKGGFLENHKIHDILLKLKPDEAFDSLTQEDILKIEDSYIKDKDDIIITKDAQGHTYVLALYVGEKQIDLIEFQIKSEKRFTYLVKKYQKDMKE